MSRAEIIFPFVLIVFVVAILTSGWMLDYSWTVIGFPFATGVVVCLLCVTIGAMAFTGRSLSVAGAPAAEVQPITIASVAWIFALGAAVYALGFVFGPAVYLLAYLRANDFSWRLSLSVAVGSLAVTWGLFIKALHVLLPIQPLWWS